MFEIIKSSGFLVIIIGKLGKKTLMKHTVSLTKSILQQLAAKSISSVIYNFERKTIRGSVTV